MSKKKSFDQTASGLFKTSGNLIDLNFDSKDIYILQELAKPGRDPRQQIEMFEFDKNIHSIHDLQKGMRLPGIVTNITNFGAFVDIGVHQDGLVHVSQMANRFVKDPNEVVKLNQKVMVEVTDVDLERNRIQLSMKEQNTN